MKPLTSRSRFWLPLALTVLSLPALAQGVFRQVGPDGRVIFSDQPPPDAAATPVPAPSAANAPDASLPFALRQTVQRYPVTLYTGKDCPPCDRGRELLRSRGVPYSEKTITTPQDAQAFARLGADTGLPRLQIGAQALNGFSDVEWTQYLDAAGYPKQSQLPRNFRLAEPTALAPQTAQPPAAKPDASSSQANAPAAAPAPQVPVQPPPSNPAGIRF